MITEETSILITGGTGSFGKSFIEYLLSLEIQPRKIIILSRDELKQWELKNKYPSEKYTNLRFLLGDIRDKERLKRAFRDVDIIVHAAALKQVHTAEYNPMEFIKTNVLGVNNIIEAALENQVKKIIALSTDKAANPVNLYGASKLCGEKLFIAANNIVGNQSISFSVVRYGNVMGSRGSVIPLFVEQSRNKKITVTDLNMTRFNISMKHAINMVHWAIENTIGSEIIVPKLPSYKISDLIEAISQDCEIDSIGIRPGEKLDEVMISKTDSISTIDLGEYYIVCPNNKDKMKKIFSHYSNLNYKGKWIEKPFSYDSGSNDDFLTTKKIRELIKEHLNLNI